MGDLFQPTHLLVFAIIAGVVLAVRSANSSTRRSRRDDQARSAGEQPYHAGTESPSTKEQRFCTRCGRHLEATVNYCPACGNQR